MLLDTANQVLVDSVTLFKLLQWSQNIYHQSSIEFKDFLPVIVGLIGAWAIIYTNKRNIDNAINIAGINADTSRDSTIRQVMLDQHNLWASELRAAASKFITAYHLESENSRLLTRSIISIYETEVALSNASDKDVFIINLKLLENQRDYCMKQQDPYATARMQAESELQILLDSRDVENINLFRLIKRISELSNSLLHLPEARDGTSEDFDTIARRIIDEQGSTNSQLRDEVHKVIASRQATLI